MRNEGLKQKPLVYGTDWDVLVVLDACRYDIFEELYRNILGDIGKLRKAISSGTHTMEWLNRTFTGRCLDDVVYVSSNAFVNSKGVSPTHGGYTFDARKHLGRVIDVWKDGWSDELGTVHPEEVNKHAIAAMDLQKEKRFIVHYMQPHIPYIYYGGENEGDPHKVIAATMEEDELSWIARMGKLAHIFFSHETIWKTGKLLGIEPAWKMGRLWSRYGQDGIRKGYREDLKLVLRYVKKLLARYPLKMFVVTADHGERLGEHGNYDHGGERDREVIEVPWLEIK